jgi:Cu-Zn family superoxide dismutase
MIKAKSIKAKGKSIQAIAVFNTNVKGEVVICNYKQGVKITAIFTALPKGKHGFHIHKAGDLRGEGCKGLCEHYDVGKHDHGDAPKGSTKGSTKTRKARHTGDLGNVDGSKKKWSYYVKDTSVKELWGRSLIIHGDEDDLGKGGFPDSKITGHSGARIACAIIGRGF